MKNCPVCGKSDQVRSSRSSGFFEKRLLRRLGIHPFRCRLCRSRFFRFSLKPRRVKRPLPEENFKKPKLPTPENVDSFEEVVAEIRRAERKAASEKASPDSAGKVRTASRMG